MEYEKLQFNARRAFFKIASDIIIVILKKEDGTHRIDIVGGGRHTVDCELLKQSDKLDAKTVEKIVNSIENSLNYKHD